MLKPLSVCARCCTSKRADVPHTFAGFFAVLIETQLQLLAREVGFCSMRKGSSRNFTVK